MTITCYGISNCDTVRKARTFLAALGVAYQFHDHRRDGVDPARLAAWCTALGWERVLNRAGTTFRKLPEADRRDLDERRAIAWMLAEPALIRRPLLDTGRTLLIGFDADLWRVAVGA